MSDLVTIEGLDGIRSVLKALPDRISTSVGYRILTDQGTAIAKLARRAAPVGAEPDEKGRKKAAKGSLARSIIVSRRLSRRQKQLHHKDAETDIEIFVGPSSKKIYGFMQEFGTHHFRPQPFMRVAWDQSRSIILGKITDDCWKEISKGLRKLGG